MRITCSSVEDFIEVLNSPSQEVLNNFIHCDTTSRGLDSSDRHRAVKVSVVFHASAVVNLPDGGQYLLDYSEDCGIDYNDHTQEKKGTERALQIRKSLKDYADLNGLRLLPGILSE